MCVFVKYARFLLPNLLVMKSIFSFLIALFAVSFVSAQTINIPDSVFKSELLGARCIDSNNDGS